MSYENLIISDRANIRVITVNRPAVLNALNKRTLLELDAALCDVENNHTVKAVVMTGAGNKSFVAGADIAEMKNLTPVEAEQMSALGHRAMDHITLLKVPVIAAVNGFALGGGLELALACDFIYANENALLGLVETKLGLIPGFGGVARLVRRVGKAQASEMIFSAAQITANEAMRIGLLNRITPEEEVVEAAVAVAEKIIQRGPYAISLVKGLIRETQDADMRTANAMEQRCFGLVFASRDHGEGIRAFLDKRIPSFEGC